MFSVLTEKNSQGQITEQIMKQSGKWLVFLHGIIVGIRTLEVKKLTKEQTEAPSRKTTKWIGDNYSDI